MTSGLHPQKREKTAIKSKEVINALIDGNVH